MNGVSLLVALASLGVVYSWRTGADQQQEYVLQIEPEIVQTLLAGAGSAQPETIYSDVPAEVGPFQRICIAILPKDSPATRHTAAGEEQFRQLLVSAGRLASRDRSLIAPDVPPTILWPGRPGAMPEQSYGVSTGWQPDSAGNQQYIVQIDPTVLSTLTVGDELYVPVEPAAGRIARFIVKAGNEKLPRIGGPGQLAQAPVTVPGGKSLSRFPGAGDGAASGWGGTSATDPQRPPARWSGGFGEATAGTDRTMPLQPPAGSQVVPRGVGYEPPTVGFGEPSAARPPATSYGGGTDAYGRSYEQYRSPAPPDLATYPAYPTPTANQTPPLPGQRQFGSAYPDNRTAALAPGPLTTPASGVPGLSNTAVTQPPQEKPWGPLLFVTFALFFSIGGNLYLAYTALEFHSRYRSAIERLRSAARSA